MEVRCDLVSGPVYLAGESVACVVTFENKSLGGDSVVVAWASAQLNCFCTVSDSKVTQLPLSLQSHNEQQRKNSKQESNTTSFQPCAGEAGLCVLSTPSKVLACDLALSPGERASFSYSEALPLTAPPSYRGHYLKYSYKLSVGTQLLNSPGPSSLLRVPIRVLSSPGPSTRQPRADTEQEALAQLGPNNPFLEEEGETDSPADLIMQTVQDLTSKRSASYFNIANHAGKVCKFCLFKKNYRLGEDIVGTFDFTVGSLRCVQYSVSLQQLEAIEPGHKAAAEQQDKVITTSKHHEVCLGFSHSHMVLPIPLALSPSFSTPLATVSYSLHFEFVLSPGGLEHQPVPQEEGGSEWQGPTNLNIETMVWDLPIKLFTTYPNHAAQDCQLSSKMVATV